MKAVYAPFADGFAVFLESQDLPGGLLVIRASISEFSARSLVDELNWAIREVERRAAQKLRQ